MASDGMQSILPSPATINFIGAPNITQNSVNVTTGGTIILTSAMLNVTAPSGIAPSSNQLNGHQFTTRHDHFNSDSAPVSNFTLAEVEAGDIQLTPMAV